MFEALVEAFDDGGWWMFPTTAFGLGLLAAAGWYAVRPVPSKHALLWVLGLLTGATGLLGFVVGVMNSILAVSAEPGGFLIIAAHGIGEALYNVACAFFLLVLSLILCGVGALRLAHSKV